eukprot:675316-Pyramimonas_sp.AAC.1
MTQVRVRLRVAASMSAAFCGASCITVGSQVVRIFLARGDAGIPRAQAEHIEAIMEEAVRQAPRRAVQPQILEVIPFDRQGRQVGSPRPRPMRPDPWVPSRAALRMF